PFREAGAEFSGMRDRRTRDSEARTPVPFSALTNAGARHVKTKRRVLGAAAAAMPAGCATSKKPQAETQAEAPAAETAAAPAPEYGTFGVDVAGMDATQSPGNHWYEYVNGTWAKNTEIPADKARYGMFNVLTDRAQ